MHDSGILAELQIRKIRQARKIQKKGPQLLYKTNPFNDENVALKNYIQVHREILSSNITAHKHESLFPQKRIRKTFLEKLVCQVIFELHSYY